MGIKKVNLKAEIEKIDAFWQLQNLAEVNNHTIKVAKLKGEYKMHKHDQSEKLFYVIEGTLCLAFADGTIKEINKGEFVVIPKGVEHKPFALEYASILLFEPTL